ncbi:hypothetical protein SAMN05421839_11656 [Halolactibacillus halophilus]|uniref:Uncharacterized protein n=1 Tax=Halolactibacillus halophilus TaxID=306540 RepID=A0A1I5PTI6_9BACI|nr:hypothetical protein [Halolactibacillus halophilus]GEM03001.1 hypothetical protein HHA03_25330 [Halolactibacillus halophilus]SFP37343.1 hypothetical protein SAMN05421839_11656 [Halolactibacillus halophilus]
MTNQKCNLNCEVQILEREINKNILETKYFKNSTVSDKEVFELQFIRAEVLAKTEHSKSSTYIVLLAGIAIAYLLNAIAGQSAWGEIVNVFIYIPMISIAFIWLDSRNKRDMETYSYLVSLLDMLILKKEEIKRNSAE